MKCWYLYPELADRDKLLELIRQGLTIQEICQTINCTRTNLNSALRNHGITRPLAGNIAEDTRKKLKL